MGGKLKAGKVPTLKQPRAGKMGKMKAGNPSLEGIGKDVSKDTGGD